MNPYIPLVIVVLSNTFYHICSKSTPQGINTFASLSITYAVGAVASIILYFITQKSPNLATEYSQLNWSSFALGIAIIGLETGYILMYKLGWNVSTAQTVQGAVLAVVLIAVGYFLFKETITFTKIAGVAVCLLGLYLINKK